MVPDWGVGSGLNEFASGAVFGLTDGVPELSAPTVEAAGSFLAAMREFAAEGRGGLDDDAMIGAEMLRGCCRAPTPWASIQP